MATAAQRIADLEARVADLAAEVGNLRAEAFIIRTLEEMWAGASAAHTAAVPPRRPRHLTVVAGGRS